MPSSAPRARFGEPAGINKSGAITIQDKVSCLIWVNAWYFHSTLSLYLFLDYLVHCWAGMSENCGREIYAHNRDAFLIVSPGRPGKGLLWALCEVSFSPGVHENRLREDGWPGAEGWIGQLLLSFWRQKAQGVLTLRSQSSGSLSSYNLTHGKQFSSGNQTCFPARVTFTAGPTDPVKSFS